VVDQALAAEAVDATKPQSRWWSVTPLLRLYSQSAANFYYDPEAGVPPNWSAVSVHSADQRLSAFGARTLGLRLAKALGSRWMIDLRYDVYRQQSSDRQFGAGSPSIDPFYARFIQIGVSRKLD
jgi:hypothetical protein